MLIVSTESNVCKSYKSKFKVENTWQTFFPPFQQFTKLKEKSIFKMIIYFSSLHPWDFLEIVNTFL